MVDPVEELSIVALDAHGEGVAADGATVPGALPGELVVLCTQTANDRAMRLAAKLGFNEVERFEEYGAEQWFGLRSSVTPCITLLYGPEGSVIFDHPV